ncbi:MAG: 3'-5' exonuclease [Gammaproteobacteria bacterium]|nr:MAG: 3'-5' exonuclease [Gammaproteobacteria bacterium]
MTLYLDTETTGLSPAKGDAIVEVAIVDGRGRPVLDTLVNPGRSIPWQASKIHGITDDMVRGKPTLAQLLPRVLEIIESEQVIIYNARFDAPFFPGELSQALIVECAMIRFADVHGGRWQKLDVAAEHVGHRWTGAAHRALADAQACRSVWNWLVERGHATNRADRKVREESARRAADVERTAGGMIVIRCPECQRRLRVPGGGRRLDVKCPDCRRVFRVET